MFRLVGQDAALPGTRTAAKVPFVRIFEAIASHRKCEQYRQSCLAEMVAGEGKHSHRQFSMLWLPLTAVAQGEISTEGTFGSHPFQARDSHLIEWTSDGEFLGVIKENPLSH